MSCFKNNAKAAFANLFYLFKVVRIPWDLIDMVEDSAVAFTPFKLSLFTLIQRYGCVTSLSNSTLVNYLFIIFNLVLTVLCSIIWVVILLHIHTFAPLLFLPQK